MPIMFDDPLVPSPKPGGGSGSCSSSGGGGFTPPQCPIVTNRTVCEPKTVQSCSCVNDGPKNPVTPSSWRVTEVGDSGYGGYDYIGGWRSSTTTSYDPTTQTVTLDGAPSSWNPPYPYGYTGYMRLILNCSDGSSHVLDSWTTINGHPTSNPGGSHPISSSVMNPCGTQGPIEDVSGRDENDCNNAKTAYSDYKISWKCVDVVTEDCTTITDTNYVDASPTLKAGVLAGLFGGLFGSTPPPPTQIDLRTLSSDELKKFIEAGLETQKNNNPLLRDIQTFERAKSLVKEYKITTVNGKTVIEVIYKDPKKIKDTAERILTGTIEKICKETQTLINSGKTVSSNSVVGQKFLELLKAGGKISAQTLARLGPCLSRLKPLIAFLGVLAASEAEAAITALSEPSFGSSGLADSDIIWTCDPEGGGGSSEGNSGRGPKKASNNDGQLNYTDGVFLPDGSFQNHNGSISSPVPKPDSNNPSRSNFLRGNTTTNVNMRAISNINAPTDLRNNLTLNSNYGMPIQNFPVLKVAKEPPTPRDIIIIDDGKFIPGQVNYPF